MKIALLIVDKTKQIILTPETDAEKAILKVFDDNHDIKIHRAGFRVVETQGGYQRPNPDNDSVLITAVEKTEVTQ